MAEREEQIVLCAVGDMALGGILEGRLEKAEQRQATIEQVRPFFAGADLCFADLDCTFDTRGESPRPDEFLVWAGAGQLALLEDLGVDIVSQANNHSLDFGGESLEATQSALRERGIECVGAGANLQQARQPRLLQRKGLKIGFLAYASDHPWVDALPAGARSAGVAPLDPESMEEDVRALAQQVDCVVVSAHWGKEYLHFPPPAVVELGRSLVDWGAALVLGHHPHVVQGIERRGAGLICYSLGNFLFADYPQQGLVFRGGQRESLLLRAQLGRGWAKLGEVVPVRLDGESRLRLLEGEQGREAEEALARYSGALGREDYEAFWQRKARAHEMRRLWRVFNEEVVAAGWSGGIGRLLRLSRKNLGSLGRSFAEIVGGQAGGGK